MVDIERHAERAPAIRVEGVAEVEGMTERVHAGAVGGVHRVQGLDGERHLRLARVVEKRADAVLDHGMRCP